MAKYLIETDGGKFEIETDEPPQSLAGKASSIVQKVGRATAETFIPPTTQQGINELVNPITGARGITRGLQSLGETVGVAEKAAYPNAPTPLQFVRKVLVPGELTPQSAAETIGGLALADFLTPTARTAIQKTGKVGISLISPASKEAISARMENPMAVKSALSREQLGNSVVSSSNELHRQIGALDDAAKNVLSPKMTIPKETVIQKLQSLKNKYIGSSKAISNEARGSISEIDNAINGIRELNPVQQHKGMYGEALTAEGETAPTISQRQLKDVMSQYREINWTDPAASAKKDIRKLFDAELKGNPKYDALMKRVSERAKIQDIINRKLSLRYDPKTGTYATDATSGKWSPALLEGKRPETSMALKKLAKLTNNDLLAKARLTNFKEQFTGGKTQGSRMVQLGRHVGGVPGALAGAAIDKFGGDVTGRMVDTLVSKSAGRITRVSAAAIVSDFLNQFLNNQNTKDNNE